MVGGTAPWGLWVKRTTRPIAHTCARLTTSKTQPHLVGAAVYKISRGAEVCRVVQWPVPFVLTCGSGGGGVSSHTRYVCAPTSFWRGTSRLHMLLYLPHLNPNLQCTTSSGSISPHFAASQHDAARERALGAIDKELKARKRKSEGLTHSESTGIWIYEMRTTKKKSTVPRKKWTPWELYS